MLLHALLLAGVVSNVDAPISLTTSDGTGLRLRVLDADVVCGGPLCFTELRLTFENPEDRVIEGQFSIALPPGASVSRFAMKIDERWQEAEVVEKQAARRAYEDFLHRRQDPALLEQAAGNQFQARVFPIPARGRKELIIGFGHSLASSSTYSLPLAGLPSVDKLDVRVRDAAGVELLAMHKQSVVPSADARVDVKGARAVRAEDVVVIRAAAPFASTASNDVLGGLVLLVDTSASRALQLQKDIALVTEVLKQGSAASALVVVAFDQDVQEVYRGTVGGFDPAVLKKRRALGATDLGGALAWAGHLVANARTTKAIALDRVVVLTDGVATADLATTLPAALAGLKAQGVRRVDAIVRGGVRDEATLATVVKAGSDEGVVVDGDLSGAAIAGRLGKKARSGITVDVAGAAWVWPKVLDGMQPGDERVIVAELKAGAPLALKLGGAAVDVGVVAAAPAPLLRRAWAEARIARLQAALSTAKSPGERKEIKEQIVAVSTRHRVLSSETALLVLESEGDYARYGIDRKSLADILVVDDQGLRLVGRTFTEPPKPKVDEAALQRKAQEQARERAKESDGQAMKKSASRAKEGEDEGEAEGGAPEDVADAAPQAEAAPGALEAKDAAPEAEKSSAEERPSLRPSSPASAAAPPPPPPPPSPARRAPRSDERRDRADDDSGDRQTFVNPWSGPFDEGMKLLRAGKADQALKKARGWREEAPGDLLALLLLAEVLQDSDPEEAARALGSIIDLYPQRADLRRAAGARLDRLKATRAKPQTSVSTIQLLAIDTWRNAVEQRPDHPQSHRGLAWSLLRAGRFADAYDAAENALKQKYRADGFRGVDQILREDLGLIAAAWKARGGPRDLDSRVKKAGGVVADGPSLRFVLWWETDANDVDFHIRDGKNNHAYYSSPQLASGGNLYADVTTGYGPECFTIPGSKRAWAYKLSAHYYSRGPMGFGLGTMLVVDHDGKGGFTFSDRPFVIMVDGAFVDLGTVAARP